MRSDISFKLKYLSFYSDPHDLRLDFWVYSMFGFLLMWIICSPMVILEYPSIIQGHRPVLGREIQDICQLFSFVLNSIDDIHPHISILD